MENSINDRITAIMDTQRLNINNFSKEIGKSYTAVHNIIKGNSKPGFDLLEAIMERYPELNPDWLMMGKGDMLRLPQKPADGGAFGETVIGDMARNLESLKQVFEDELKAKNSQIAAKDTQIQAQFSQIASLTRMLENAMGKPEDTSDESRVLPLWSELKEAV